jgi:hypothetical protein
MALAVTLQNDLICARPKPPVTSRNEGCLTVGEAAEPNKSALRIAKRAPEACLCHVQGWEREWERVLLRGALSCFNLLARAPPDLHRRTFLEAAAP